MILSWKKLISSDIQFITKHIENGWKFFARFFIFSPSILFENRLLHGGARINLNTLPALHNKQSIRNPPDAASGLIQQRVQVGLNGLVSNEIVKGQFPNGIEIVPVVAEGVDVSSLGIVFLLHSHIQV